MIAVFAVTLYLPAQTLKKTTNKEIYDAVNSYRIENGLKPLEISGSLEISSTLYAATSSVKNTYGKHSRWWAKRQNRDCGEVIGLTYKPVESWKKSYSHKKILLASRFTHMGAGKSGGVQVLRFIRKT